MLRNECTTVRPCDHSRMYNYAVLDVRLVGESYNILTRMLALPAYKHHLVRFKQLSLQVAVKMSLQTVGSTSDFSLDQIRIADKMITPVDLWARK